MAVADACGRPGKSDKVAGYLKQAVHRAKTDRMSMSLPRASIHLPKRANIH